MAPYGEKACIYHHGIPQLTPLQKKEIARKQGGKQAWPQVPANPVSVRQVRAKERRRDYLGAKIWGQGSKSL